LKKSIHGLYKKEMSDSLRNVGVTAMYKTCSGNGGRKKRNRR